MKLLTLFIFVCLVACNRSSSDEYEPPPDILIGSWTQVDEVCSTVSYKSTNKTNQLTLDGANYEWVTTAGGCKATRTGTYTITKNVLRMSYSALSCIPNNCTTTYTMNSVTQPFECPGTGANTLSTDGVVYAISIDSTTLFITTMSGPTTGCYYKFNRKP